MMWLLIWFINPLGRLAAKSYYLIFLRPIFVPWSAVVINVSDSLLIVVLSNKKSLCDFDFVLSIMFQEKPLMAKNSFIVAFSKGQAR